MDDQVTAIKRSIDSKIEKLKEMQRNNEKFQHIQLIREEIWHLKRMLAGLQGKKNDR